MARKTGRKGGKYGNKNAVSHGAFEDLTPEKVDRRTRTGKALAEIEATLVDSLADPSPQEVILIQRIAVKLLRCLRAEKAILSKKEVSESLEREYLRWSRELRQDLQAIGLERRSKDLIDLQAYVKEAYGKKEAQGEG